VVDAHAHVLARDAEVPRGRVAGDELPGEADRVTLEIVAEREVAEHLEEGVVPGGVPHLLEVVVLAAGAHALLCGRRAPAAAGGSSIPRKTFLNGTIPALVNSRVGSSPGTSVLLGRTRWPWRSK
jgi:hypothetical protein